jgi:chromosome segregation ATPase
VAQRLFADHYWTKINEVYTSGQGSFGTAVVKDDIGNWTLKSFDNDPSELLQAYHKLARAGIQAAVRLARTASSGGASEALDVANKFLQGRAGSLSTVLANDVRLESLQEQNVAELTALQQKAEQQVPALRTAVQGAQERANQAKAEVERTRKNYDQVSQGIRGHEEAIITVQREMLEQRNVLQAIEDKLRDIDNELKTLDTTDPRRDALVRDSGALTQQQTQHMRTLQAAGQQLQELVSTLEQTKTAEPAELKNWKFAEEERLKAQFALETKEQELRAFVTETMREARKILEVHRRVIDALKNRQVKTE